MNDFVARWKGLELRDTIGRKDTFRSRKIKGLQKVMGYLKEEIFQKAMNSNTKIMCVKLCPNRLQLSWGPKQWMSTCRATCLDLIRKWDALEKTRTLKGVSVSSIVKQLITASSVIMRIPGDISASLVKLTLWHLKYLSYYFFPRIICFPSSLPKTPKSELQKALTYFLRALESIRCSLTHHGFSH